MYSSVSISFNNLGITLEDLGQNISIFGFEIAYYGIVIVGARLYYVILSGIITKTFVSNIQLKSRQLSNIRSNYSCSYYMLWIYKVKEKPLVV